MCVPLYVMCLSHYSIFHSVFLRAQETAEYLPEDLLQVSIGPELREPAGMGREQQSPCVCAQFDFSLLMSESQDSFGLSLD